MAMNSTGLSTRTTEASHVVSLEIEEELCKFRFSIHNFRLCELKSASHQEFISPAFVSPGSGQIEWRLKVNVDHAGQKTVSELAEVSCEIECSKDEVDSEPTYYFVNSNGDMEKLGSDEMFTYTYVVENLLLNGSTLTVQCDLRIFHPITQTPCGSSHRSNDSNLRELQSHFRDLHGNPKNSDVVFRCGDQEIEAHKAILSARSSVFCRMFEHDTKENQEGVIVIEDATPETIRSLLQYLYCAELDLLTAERYMQLYRVADKYNLENLKFLCSESIMSRLSVENVCEAAILSHLCSDKKLLSTVKRFLHAHITTIMASPDWINLVLKYQHLANELAKP